MPDNSPFFIVGSGRSGTTLLRMILAGHSRLHIPPETDYILILVAALPLTAALALAGRACGRSDRRGLSLAGHGDAGRGVPRRADGAAGDQASPTSIEHRSIATSLAQAGKARFGDKTPDIHPDHPATRDAVSRGEVHPPDPRRPRRGDLRIDLDYDRYYQANFEWTLAMRCRQQYCNRPYAQAEYWKFATRTSCSTWSRRYAASAVSSVRHSNLAC